MVSSTNILEVNLSKIRKNIGILKNITNKKFYAVVKANGYGLGALKISKEIEQVVDGYCVATFDEAVELRDAEIKKDILVLGYINPIDYDLISKYNIITTIYDFNIAKELNKLGENIRCHIKIETGHNRLGFKSEDKYFEQIRDINKLENIKIEGIFSHLSTADEENREYTNIQHEKFEYAIKQLSDINHDWVKHLSNDAGVIAFEFNYDAIRSGISMYGVYPSEYIKDKYILGLECSFELKSKISFIKEIDEGETISYGRTFKAKKKTKVATVAIGYADGYHRLISNKGYVLVNGEKAYILGNITMDQMMIDVTNIDVNLHDEVVLIGKSQGLEITPEQVANWANTIPYEIMTSISSKRVSRVYIIEE